MSFTGLAVNQAVSYTNLQDAVTNGIFTLVSAITSSGHESTKSYVAAHVSGFNANYPPYAIKASNQLIVQGDIYNPGNFILDAQYGKSFTSISGSVGLPTFQPSAFSFPVTGGNTTKQYNGAVAAQTITVGLTGTLFVSPAKVVLYVDGVQVDCQNIANGVQTKTLNLSVTVGSPSTIKISINGGTCSSTPTTPVFSGKCFSTVSVNRGSGQYMVAGNSYLFNSGGFTQGYLYYSLDYGSTWAQNSTFGYWLKISSSDDGRYVIAIDYSGYAYLSSDYAATFTKITSIGQPGGVGSWADAALSNDGRYQLMAGNNINSYGDSGIYCSLDYGASWSIVYASAYDTYGSCAMSANGLFLVGGGAGGSSLILRSTDYGASWNTVYSALYGSSVTDMKITASSGWVLASNNGTAYDGFYLIKSSDSGATFTQINGGAAKNSWMRVAINNTVSGLALYYLGGTGTSYIQQVTGLGPVFMDTVSNLNTSGVKNWHAVACSDNGTYILAGERYGLYLSTNGGSSFTAL